ncbi:ATP-binding protein, partial [Actinotalea fermentans]|uniref:Histidine kinase/HSP90-like ATPase domain-containing protein n=1 Tax=Actinotalea fermentans TaxID=43671 RepID=A0A511YWP4_9CELL
MRFVADVTEIRHARTWVVSEAAHVGAPEDIQRVVALLASEVVTNAIKHGPAGGRIDVGVSRTGDRLRVSVHDESAQRPVRLEPGPTALSGRGVLLVDRLAAAWDVQPDAGGKTVWFEVSLRRRPTPGRGR